MIVDNCSICGRSAWMGCSCGKSKLLNSGSGAEKDAHAENETDDHREFVKDGAE